MASIGIVGCMISFIVWLAVTHHTIRCCREAHSNRYRIYLIVIYFFFVVIFLLTVHYIWEHGDYRA